MNRKLAKEVSKLLSDVLGIPADRVYLNFSNVEARNWDGTAALSADVDGARPGPPYRTAVRQERPHCRLMHGNLPEEKGTYVLIASAPRMKRVEIGRLGRFDIPPGFYAYVGSAFGAGDFAPGWDTIWNQRPGPIGILTIFCGWLDRSRFGSAPRLGSWNRSGPVCWKPPPNSASPSRGLDAPTLPAAAPATCSTPAAGPAFAGSNNGQPKPRRPLWSSDCASRSKGEGKGGVPPCLKKMERAKGFEPSTFTLAR